jgi:predicted amidophosphoribosyltransferase
MYVAVKPKDNAIWVKCKGEAHNPAVAGNIDHCGICMPEWAYYPTCPKCTLKLKSDTGYCRNCKKYFRLSIMGQLKDLVR